jgi:G3E family GTPase
LFSTARHISPFLAQCERRSQFDRVVIETTGLAQPAPIIQTFFLEPSVAARMRLDGVVTLVRGPVLALRPLFDLPSARGGNL